MRGEIRHHLLTEQVRNGFPPGRWRQREGVRVTRGHRWAWAATPPRIRLRALVQTGCLASSQAAPMPYLPFPGCAETTVF